MFRQVLKPNLLKQCTSSSVFYRHSFNHLKLKTSQLKPIAHLNACNSLKSQPIQTREFHASRPSQVPLIALPGILLSFVKTGKLVSFVSYSTKAALTLLPYSFRRFKESKTEKLILALTTVPIVGISLLALVGLDKAPNTSRLRFVYLSQEEENEVVIEEFTGYIGEKIGLLVSEESDMTMWLQQIVNNIALVTVDDIREPVRRYRSPPAEDGEESDDTSHHDMFNVYLIKDDSTVNAACIGRFIVVYNLLCELMDYDSTKMAVILSHELAHSVQRHFVEEHGLESMMIVFSDILRSIFWFFTGAAGPHVNELITKAASGFINLETSHTYNRKLEREADLIGLKFLAKAGYDPRVAVEVWKRFGEFEEAMRSDGPSSDNGSNSKLRHSHSVDSSKRASGEYFESLIDDWFGSTHPPTLERIEYMESHMDDAVKTYEETLKLNGPAPEYNFKEDPKIASEKPFVKQFDLLAMANLGSSTQSVSSLALTPSLNQGTLIT